MLRAVSAGTGSLMPPSTRTCSPIRNGEKIHGAEKLARTASLRSPSAELDARAGRDVRRDRPEGSLEVGERAPRDGAERLENALEVLAREESRAREVEVDRQVEQPRQDAHEVRQTRWTLVAISSSRAGENPSA